MTRRQKSIAIEMGKIQDDYHNHFLSHFGFHDEQRSDYLNFWKYHKNTGYDL
jgi:hypothetical protein